MSDGSVCQFEWEELDCSENINAKTFRAKVPRGWLVSVVGNGQGGGVTFYPDEKHKWNGRTIGLRIGDIERKKIDLKINAALKGNAQKHQLTGPISLFEIERYLTSIPAEIFWKQKDGEYLLNEDNFYSYKLALEALGKLKNMDSQSESEIEGETSHLVQIIKEFFDLRSKITSFTL